MKRTARFSIFHGLGVLSLLISQQLCNAQEWGQPINYGIYASSVDVPHAIGGVVHSSAYPVVVRGQNKSLEMAPLPPPTRETLRVQPISYADGEENAAYTLTDADSTDVFEEAGCGDADCGSPKWQFFGDFLFLRPGNAEVVYAAPIDAAGGGIPIQVGRIATVDPSYEPGFRVGFSRALDDCSSLGVTYTHLDSSTSDSITAAAPIVIRSMVIHPSSANAATDWLDANASYDVNFKWADIDYRYTFLAGDRSSMNYLIGARYGHLNQMFRSEFNSIGTETINTDVRFDGGGIRLGLEGERHARCSGLLVYGKAMASFLAGQFSARYDQHNNVAPRIVDTQWKADRIVPVLELEIGIGWASPEDRFRLTAGYTVNAWYNTVRTADFIDAVQTNEFGGLSGTMTFDGLVARAEWRH